MISLEDKIKYQTMSQEDIDFQFILACEKGDLEEVKYLLTSTNLKTTAQIDCTENFGLRAACTHNHVDIFKYLITSPDLKKHADIYDKNGQIIRIACSKENFEIIHFLILDCCMEISSLNNFFLINSHRKMYDYILKLIESRDLNEKLESNLENKQTIIKKVKI